jgi:hypothetical protein
MDMNSFDEYGRTKLTDALQFLNNGHSYHVIEELINNGADAKLKDKNGETPLYVAIVYPSYCFSSGSDQKRFFNDFTQIIKLLIEHGANPLEGVKFRTPYSFAYNNMTHFIICKEDSFEEKMFGKRISLEVLRRPSSIRKEIEINLWKPILEMLYKAIKGIPLYIEIDISESELAIEALAPNVVKEVVPIVDKLNKQQKLVRDDRSHNQSATSAIKMDSAGEIILIKSILDKTLNAEIFVNAIKSFGFKQEDESFMGLELESKYGRILLKTKDSVHPTNIATLLYLNKKTNQETYLVEDGIRC